MDEVFWANVVKRWSDASETVLQLRKELAKVQEERELYRDVVQSLRKSSTVRDPSRSRASGHAREESITTIVVDDEHAGSALQDELKDAEIGLGRAKEEYRRLQKGLAESMERVRALTVENERLVANQQASLREERRQSHAEESELGDLRSENQRLLNKVHQLEQELQQLKIIIKPSRTRSRSSRLLLATPLGPCKLSPPISWPLLLSPDASLWLLLLGRRLWNLAHIRGKCQRHLPQILQEKTSR
ncbi:hypothetical protein CPB83DRAFT_55696 [Crepidotus variabilis]|uniref:Uncharacterized protein n=1 Tax=Crepidotus variabilis TaxID=179855 RepID=A0A9P6ENC9_9AGAR|nr:hypothetical protein CPB83DRAFT_55696 [Crepidotus variabilis]